MKEGTTGGRKGRRRMGKGDEKENQLNFKE